MAFLASKYHCQESWSGRSRGRDHLAHHFMTGIANGDDEPGQPDELPPGEPDEMPPMNPRPPGELPMPNQPDELPEPQPGEVPPGQPTELPQPGDQR